MVLGRPYSFYLPSLNLLQTFFRISFNPPKIQLCSRPRFLPLWCLAVTICVSSISTMTPDPQITIYIYKNHTFKSVFCWKSNNLSESSEIDVVKPTKFFGSSELSESEKTLLWFLRITRLLRQQSIYPDHYLRFPRLPVLAPPYRVLKSCLFFLYKINF